MLVRPPVPLVVEAVHAAVARRREGEAAGEERGRAAYRVRADSPKPATAAGGAAEGDGLARAGEPPLAAPPGCRRDRSTMLLPAAFWPRSPAALATMQPALIVVPPLYEFAALASVKTPAADLGEGVGPADRAAQGEVARAADARGGGHGDRPGQAGGVCCCC